MCLSDALGYASINQVARGIKILWWLKVTVPAKTLYILNSEVVLITVWGVANLGLQG